MEALLQISQKETLSHFLSQPSALGGNLTIWFFFLDPPNKAFLSPLVWPRREYTWTVNWKDILLIFSENCQQDLPYTHRQTRSRMINTFIIVNITPLVRNSSTSKRTSFSLQLDQEHNTPGNSFERKPYWFVLKATKIFTILT